MCVLVWTGTGRDEERESGRQWVVSGKCVCLPKKNKKKKKKKKKMIMIRNNFFVVFEMNWNNLFLLIYVNR